VSQALRPRLPAAFDVPREDLPEAFFEDLPEDFDEAFPDAFLEDFDEDFDEALPEDFDEDFLPEALRDEAFASPSEDAGRIKFAAVGLNAPTVSAAVPSAAFARPVACSPACPISRDAVSTAPPRTSRATSSAPPPRFSFLAILISLSLSLQPSA
jgi:hypothetical protein